MKTSSIRTKGIILGVFIFSIFVSLQLFVWYRMHNVNEQTDMVHENLLLFGFILVANIAINIALAMFTNKIVFNLHSLEGGLKSFFSYLNRKDVTLKKVRAKGNDEFQLIATLLNKNISSIEKDLEMDKNTVEEVGIVIKEVAKGNFSKRVATEAANPEIIQLKEELNIFIQSLQSTMSRTLEIVENYKNGNFSSRMQQDSIGELQRLNEGVNSLGEMLKNSQNQIQTSLKSKSQILDTSAKKLQANIDYLNTFAKQSETNTHTISQEMGLMKEQIEATVLKTKDMKEQASKSLKDAQKGEVLANKTALSMKEIEESTEEINSAIVAIDSIAFQTNILSLNAAVEAATAGEAGKGFAVVAQEVRTLASKSAEAAKYIKELVEKTQSRANEGIVISKNMKENFENVKQQLDQTTVLVSKVSEDANLEMKKIVSINEIIKESNDLTHQNTLIAQDTEEISSEIFKIAQDLVNEVSQKQTEGVS